MPELLQHEAEAERADANSTSDRLTGEPQANVATETPAVKVAANLRAFIHYNKRFKALFLAGLLGPPLLYGLASGTILSSVAWWSQWPGEIFRYVFGFVWLFGLFAAAMRMRFLDHKSWRDPEDVVQTMQTLGETDPLALEAAVPAIEDFVRSAAADEAHKKIAQETLERIDAAREAIGNLPIEACAPVVPSDDLPVAVSAVEPSQPDAGTK